MRTVRILLTLILTITCLATLNVSHAKKPTEPPGGGGGNGDDPTEVIYFAHGNDTVQMSPDGNGKAGLNIGYWGTDFEPSAVTHAGRRLFLNWFDGDVTVMKEDGTSETLLADGVDGNWVAGGGFRWISDGSTPDMAISWIANDFDTGEVAIVRADVVYDETSGDISGIDLNSLEHFTGLSYQYDWSPDGSLIVFNDQGNLWVLDTVSMQTMPLPVANVYGSPRWSPDGEKITYGISDSAADVSRIETLDLFDGSITVIADGRLRTPIDGTVVLLPQWSPDSSAILFHFVNVRGYEDETDIIRANASGKGKQANLTADLNGSPPGPRVIGWRVVIGRFKTRHRWAR